MSVALRPGAAVGVALVGAGLIAATPAFTPPCVISQPARDIALTADADFLTAWKDVFDTASENATKVSQYFLEAPLADMQQSIVNSVGYVRDIISDPSSIGDVFERMGADAQSAFQAATLLGGNPEDLDFLMSVYAANNDDHAMLLTIIPSFLPEGSPEFVPELLNAMASPLSGVLIASLGPALSPLVAALNSLQDGDLLNLPANVVNGLLNGATLNLDALVPMINDSGFLPEGTTFEGLSIAFGGLLTPGATSTGVDGNFEPSLGGSLFNSIGLSLTTDQLGPSATLELDGVAVGPLAAMTNLSQMLAGALGWDGDGNPLADLAGLFD